MAKYGSLGLWAADLAVQELVRQSCSWCKRTASVLRQAGIIGPTLVFDQYQPYCKACVEDRSGPEKESLLCLNVGEIKNEDNHAFAKCVLNDTHSGPCRIEGYGGRELLDPAPGRCEHCGTTNGINRRHCAQCRIHLWD